MGQLASKLPPWGIYGTAEKVAETRESIEFPEHEELASLTCDIFKEMWAVKELNSRREEMAMCGSYAGSPAVVIMKWECSVISTHQRKLHACPEVVTVEILFSSTILNARAKNNGDLRRLVRFGKNVLEEGASMLLLFQITFEKRTINRFSCGGSFVLFLWLSGVKRALIVYCCLGFSFSFDIAVSIKAYHGGSKEFWDAMGALFF